MQKRLLTTTLLIGALGMAAVANAQNSGFAYAITDLQATGKDWNALRKLDLRTGEFSDVLFNGADARNQAYDATTKKAWTAFGKYAKEIQTPFGTGVAAAAYDNRTNRLYFTPMYIDQLRYIDLNTMKLYYVTDMSFTRTANMSKNEAAIITRMTFTPDGTGYALSNDGNNFIRFTTGKKPEIKQMGALIDDSSNSGVSVHTFCTCGGGDMFSDDEGKLYVITARNNVFKVDAETKEAKLVAYIRNLPKDFSTDGAAITTDGKVLLSSIHNGTAYFLADPANWSAKQFESKNGIFRSSDLASANYLKTKPDKKDSTKAIQIVPDNLSKVTIYPNPVSSGQFTLQFNQLTPGTYHLEMMNLNGQAVLLRDINVQSEGQSETISYKSSLPKSVYLLRITGANSTAVFNQKIVVL